MSILTTLAKAGIAYETRRFAPDLSAEAATAAIGLPLDAILKTLVCETAAGGIILVCLPVPAKLDMTKLSATLGEPVAGLVGRSDLARRTGFTAGALSHPAVGVGGGEAGLEILLRPRDLVSVCGAMVASVCEG